MQNRIIAKNVSPKNIRIVRDGADIPVAIATPTVLDSEVIRRIRRDFRFVLLHAGNLGFYGAWDTLIRGAEQLADEGIGLVFVGDGAQRDSLQSAAKDIPNISFLPFFPGNKIPSVLAAADAHVVTVKRGLEGVVVPSKMYGILAAGKPIVAVAPEACDVVSIGKARDFLFRPIPTMPPSSPETVRGIAADPDRLAKWESGTDGCLGDLSEKRELVKLRSHPREVRRGKKSIAKKKV